MQFGSFQFDEAKGALTGPDGEPIRLRPQTASVLAALIAEAGAIVSKEALLDRVWGDLNVTEDSLFQCIAEIRRALGEDGRDMLQTVPKKGYRLVAGQTPHVPEVRDRRPGPRLVAAAALVAFAVIAGLWMRQSPSPPASSTEAPVIAVLTPRDLTGEARWQRIAQGLGAELANDLAQSDWIEVLAPASDADQDRKAPPGARFVLSGTLLAQADGLRATMRLTDQRDGTIVWSDRWSGPADGIFDFQDEVLTSVTGVIAGYWSGAVAERDRRVAHNRPTDSLDAYENYLLGAEMKHRFTPESYRKAIVYLKRATEIDPDYVNAWSTLSIVYALMSSNITDWDELVAMQAERAAAIDRAAELDPNSPNVLIQQNWLKAFRGDFAGAEQSVRRAVEIAPNNPDVLAEAAWISNWRSAMGADTVEWAERAKRLNPKWPAWYAMGPALAAFNMGDYAVTVASLTEAPNFIERHLYTAAAEALLGHPEAARAARERLFRLMPGFDLATYMQARQILQEEVAGPLIEGARLAGIPYEPA